MILLVDYAYLVQSFGEGYIISVDFLVIYVILDPALRINVHVLEDLFYLASHKLVTRVGKVYGDLRILSAFWNLPTVKREDLFSPTSQSKQVNF